MTKLQKLQGEAAHTCNVLREAAERLAQWAVLLEADFFKSALPPEEVRAADPGIRLTLLLPDDVPAAAVPGGVFDAVS